MRDPKWTEKMREARVQVDPKKVLRKDLEESRFLRHGEDMRVLCGVLFGVGGRRVVDVPTTQGMVLSFVDPLSLQEERVMQVVNRVQTVSHP